MNKYAVLSEAEDDNDSKDNSSGEADVMSDTDLYDVSLQKHSQLGANVMNVLETHLKPSNIDKTCNYVFERWNWMSNVAYSSNSCRIVVGWDSNVVNVMVIHIASQVILCLIETVDKVSKFYCSFIYASNNGYQRQMLWEDLKAHDKVVNKFPWVLMGDFNITRRVSEHSSGCSHVNWEMRDFNECIDDIEVDDLGSSGFHFTWTKSLKNPSCSILRKLDRVMCNEGFLASYSQAYGVFHPYLIFDHSPTVLGIPHEINRKKRAFRFMNHVANKDQFLDVVSQKWCTHVQGCKMFQVFSKLKLLKKDLNKLNWENAIDANPHDASLRVEASATLLDYEKAKSDEMIVLKQKAKIKWLAEGDRNTRFFHSVLKSRKQKSRIESVCDVNNDRFYGDQVGNQFVMYFQEFLGVNGQCRPVDEIGDIFSKKLSNAEALEMVRHVTNDEIRSAMFDIDDNKASGPDGYSSLFFKKACSIIGNDVCDAIKDFLTMSAFIPGRAIHDNILVAQEVLKGYNRRSGPKRCALKIDIQKAYDTVNWCFLKDVLSNFGFHEKMIQWIMACVTSTSFSICVNGESVGFFK
ncbi:uncharacterized protein [Rutidosis leptorrhynchoides]|uniref:uncharacterized protein n=1 Tax=Rutidosis leptorrhynchoides TaxID=125765 RepID=UPI003A9A27C9